jgi:hypothetical protein
MVCLSSTSAPSLVATSAFSLYNAMTLRLGYKFCVEYMNKLAIEERLETDSMSSVERVEVGVAVEET